MTITLRWVLCVSVLLGWGAPAAGCEFLSVNVSSLEFGDYVAFDPAPLDSEAVIEVRCLREGAPLSYRIELGGGTNGDPRARGARFGSHLLYYNLFLDPARVRVWGSGQSGAAPLEERLEAGQRESHHWISGRVPGGQQVRPGTYSDQVTITVLF